MFEKFIVKKSGFSIAEALIAMLIIATVAMLSAPIITKKMKLTDANVVHGQWVCYYDHVSKKYKYGTASDIDSKVKKWKTGECKFPVLPKNVRFLWVEVIGAGGGGSRGYAEPWVDEYKYYKWGEPVENKGVYEVILTPSLAEYNVVQPSWRKSLFEKGSDYVYKTKPNSDMMIDYCPAPGDNYSHSSFMKTAKEDQSYSYGGCKTYTHGGNSCKPQVVENSSDEDAQRASAATANGCLFTYLDKGISKNATCTAGEDIKCTKDSNGNYSSNSDKVPTCTCAEEADSCVIHKKGAKFTCTDEVSFKQYEFIALSGPDDKPTQDELNKTHTYCGLQNKNSTFLKDTLPPVQYNSLSYIEKACKDYKESTPKYKNDKFTTCETKGNSVIFSSFAVSCVAKCFNNSLTDAYLKTPVRYGIKGTVELRPGETLHYKTFKEGNVIKSASSLKDSGAYELQEFLPSDKKIKVKNNLDDEKDDSYTSGYAKDGDTIVLYHRKVVQKGDEFETTDIPVATFKGPTSGKLGKTSGDRCCNCCSGDEYPNSEGKNSSQCAVDSNPVVITIHAPYQGLFSVVSATNSNHFRILEQKFVSGYGCYGGDGRSAASLLPASNNTAYKFHVGKGGTGARGFETLPDNRVQYSATDGEASYFSFISAAGGDAAADSCQGESKPTASTSKYDFDFYPSVAKGGIYGGVTLHQNPPKRNYYLSVSEDTNPWDPTKRWSVQDAGDGKGGLIRVSW